jgi:choline dehydrogenase-like flavoprotein
VVGSSLSGQAMQRGFPEDFDAWAALGTEEWSYAKVLPYFIKSEHDLDVLDDFHGTEGPLPVRRRQSGPWPDSQKAFHAACIQAALSAATCGATLWPSVKTRVAVHHAHMMHISFAQWKPHGISALFFVQKS